jgi:hypothetical protein
MTNDAPATPAAATTPGMSLGGLFFTAVLSSESFGVAATAGELLSVLPLQKRLRGSPTMPSSAKEQVTGKRKHARALTRVTCLVTCMLCVFLIYTS